VYPLLVFDTTHHALWAEQIATEKGLAAQVVPAPPEAEAKCDLALEYLPSDGTALLAALQDAHVPYREHVRSDAADPA
jgi:hypothetical protein